MAMGMPCVSTECGSVAEFIRHGENGLLYRYEEPEVCAYYIAEIFENRSLRENLSRKAALVWTQQHNHTLTGIYRALTEQKEIDALRRLLEELEKGVLRDLGEALVRFLKDIYLAIRVVGTNLRVARQSADLVDE